MKIAGLILDYTQLAAALGLPEGCEIRDVVQEPEQRGCQEVQINIVGSALANKYERLPGGSILRTMIPLPSRPIEGAFDPELHAALLSSVTPRIQLRHGWTWGIPFRQKVPQEDLGSQHIRPR